jgi:hypothetical protein
MEDKEICNDIGNFITHLTLSDKSSRKKSIGIKSEQNNKPIL